MRQFSESMKILFAHEPLVPIYMVRIITPSGEILDTTYRRDITLAGIGTFTHNSGLMVVEPPRLSQSVDREAYKITYADPQFNKRELFELALVGSRVTSYFTLENTTADVLNGIDPGQPMTDMADVVIAYEGVVDVPGYAVDPEEGTVIAVMECSSPMASLGIVKSFFTSRDSLRKIDASDTAFDQVYIGLSKVTHLWGKA